MKLNHLLSATALAGSAIVFPAIAVAQDTPPASGTTAQSEGTIVVTGSRIARPNLNSTVPITSVDPSDLLDGGELNIGDTLNQLPALRSTFSQANSTRFIGTAGLNTLDLRGLGNNRTLVLINGRRQVSATPGSYQVDINTIPTELLDRVDVVTGGNSAVYGSDAVSGVVNFILKKDYEGIALNAQGGVSTFGDRGSYSLSGVYGTNFADGRGNIAVSAGYARSRELFFTDRPAQTGAFDGPPGFYTVDNTLGEPAAGDGIADTAFFGVGTKFNFISLGGTLITTCPAATATNAARRALNCTGGVANTGGLLNYNFHFQPDGSLVRDFYTLDLRPVGGGIFGGLSATGFEGAMLLPGLERVNATFQGRYEFSPLVTAFIEGSYTRILSNQTSTQPTFVNGRLSPTFRTDNPYLTAQARDLIFQTLGVSGATPVNFTMNRFNNDIGTRSEQHERQTYRFVAGFRGTPDLPGTWGYEVAFNYGRTETYYETGGNVNVARFNRAADAARDATGNIVCRVNIDAITTNDDPACRPINLFGNGAPQTTPAGLAYVLHTSWRRQWAEMLNATAFVSGDSTALFELPGGPVSFALGLEYRREDALSVYDPITASNDATGGSTTFLNNIGAFDPPSINLWEAFGEIRIPILRDTPGFQELSIEGAGRVSKYSNIRRPVYAWNAGAIWSPFRGLRLRGNYSRSVRTPNIGEVYGTRSETFANGLVDPCSQTQINLNPNRVRNCAAAGIPTTITLPDGSVVPWVNTAGSGVSGFNQGNPNLEPEVSNSWSVGGVFQPEFIRGLSISVDYYRIRINQAISGLTGQAIINRCYDDPVSINNPFCSAVFRRFSATDPILNGTFAGQTNRRFTGFPDFILPQTGPGFLNQPFNFAKIETSGIDAEIAWRGQVFGAQVRTRAIISWLERREFFTFISAPAQSTRVHGVLGDPIWSGAFNLNVAKNGWDIDYDVRFLDRMTIGTWETQFSHQGRPPQNADAFPVTHYPTTFYHDIQIGYRVNENFRFYFGVDNVMNTLPPYGLTGTGDGSGIYPVQGRYFYSGVRIKF